LYVVNVEETEGVTCPSCKIMEAKFDRYAVPSDDTNIFVPDLNFQ